MPNSLKGIHKVRKTLADGSKEVYRYAWRGGPRLLSEPHTDDFHIEYAAALQSRKSVTGDTLNDLCGQYIISPEFTTAIGAGTRKYRLGYMNDIRRELGDLTLDALSDISIKEVFIKWRNQYADTPKAADMRIETLSVILSLAMQKGKIAANHTNGITQLYKNNRAEVIWTDGEIEAVKDSASSACAIAIDFARLSGLRKGDCIAITWDADKGQYLDWTTSKTQKRVLVPVLPDMRALLDSLPKTGPTILLSTAGKPWKAPALQNAFYKAKNKAGIDKRFHDIRGTFATMLIENGVSDERVADIMGWSKARVSEIRRLYVSPEAIMNDVLRQISVNQTVNRKLNEK